MIHAYAAQRSRGELKPFDYDPGALGPEEVEIEVESCGICHSDLSMLYNEWHLTQFPLVPGHEVIGTIAEMGGAVTHLRLGQRVGLGWQSSSCQACEYCVGGDHNLCADAEATIVKRHSGFADRVRANHLFTIPIPDAMDPVSTGPMLCGGITVFNPLVQFNIQPTDRVGVIGIGGLGHLALQFLRAWGCEVTAFTSTPSKAEEARQFGAHYTLDSRDINALKNAAGSLDLILCTANADLDWSAYLSILRPKGRLHFVGVPPGVIGTPAFPLISGQKSISGTPSGSPATIAKMLQFAGRHKIKPKIEVFPFDHVNEAMEHLRSGKARYRIVLKR